MDALYFKGSRQFKKVAGESYTVVAGLIYGGTEMQRRSDALVQGVLDCDSLFGELLVPG